MNCRHARLLFTKRLYEALTPAEGASLSLHLDRCRTCRAEATADEQFEPILQCAAAQSEVFVHLPAQPLRIAPATIAWRCFGMGLGVTALAAACLAAWVTSQPKESNQSQTAVHVTQPTPNTPQSTKREVERKPSPVVARSPLAHLGPLSPRETLPIARPQDDAKWLDGTDASLMAQWMVGDPNDAEIREWLRRLPPVRDDFVEVPLPRFAAAETNPQALKDGIRKYEKEAAVVDARLAQKVIVAAPGYSCEELCKQLERLTNVRLTASRAVQDEKVTVFVKERPVRDVMRAVARLFGFKWARSGQEGAYKYELIQDLRTQLAEQEMRDRDLRAALVALDQEMQAYQGLLDLSPEQLRERAQGATGAEKARLHAASGAGWGGMQLYHRMTPAERAAMLDGQEVWFRSSATDPSRKIPGEWNKLLFSVFGGNMAYAVDKATGLTVGGPAQFLRDKGLTPRTFEDDPEAGVDVNLQINRGELGQLSLETGTIAHMSIGGSQPGIGVNETLARAQSPSVANPENAKANAALRKDPRLQKEIDLKPHLTCPKAIATEEARRRGIQPPKLEEVMQSAMRQGRNFSTERWRHIEQYNQPHVCSADFWAEVHEKTGLPIVADSYSRAYPQRSLTIKATAFEALCKCADEMRVRWRIDDDFLLARSTGFFWNKLKEVPNRYLQQWAPATKAEAGLSLDQVLQMSLLTDQQLDSEVVGGVVEHCWDVPEWHLLQKPAGYYSPRPWLRIFASLPVGFARQALTIDGAPVAGMPAEAQKAVGELMQPRHPGPVTANDLAGWRVRIGYAPRGSYIWAPFFALGPVTDIDRLPLISGKTRDDVLKKARQINRNVTPEQVIQTDGILNVIVLYPNGNAIRIAGEGHARPRINDAAIGTRG